MQWDRAADIIENILPGETVLLETRPSYTPEFVLKFFVEYSKTVGKTLVIDDNLDALHVLVTHLEKLGVELGIGDVPVIKTGGRKEVGRVMAHIPFHPDPRVYIKNYRTAAEELYRGLGGGDFINLVLGLDHLFLHARSPRDSYSLILFLQDHVGDRRRRSFYLTNRETMKALPFRVLHELERISTTVLDLVPYATGVNVEVLKSPKLSLLGTVMSVDVGGEFLERK